MTISTVLYVLPYIKRGVLSSDTYYTEWDQRLCLVTMPYSIRSLDLPKFRGFNPINFMYDKGNTTPTFKNFRSTYSGLPVLRLLMIKNRGTDSDL
jgi:hypothetical protein